MNGLRWGTLTSALVVVAACSGQSDSSTKASVDSAAVAPTPAAGDSSATGRVDSVTKAPDSATAKQPGLSASPTGLSPKPAAKVETGDYDKVIRPRFKVDEKTGKIDTIRKP